MAMSDNVYIERLFILKEKARDQQSWVKTRHNYFYEWYFFGWRQLPSEYPLNQQPDDKNPNNISNWVHKRLSHTEYLSNKLYYQDNWNQAYHIDLVLEVDNDDQSENSFVDRSLLGRSIPKIWSFLETKMAYVLAIKYTKISTKNHVHQGTAMKTGS